MEPKAIAVLPQRGFDFAYVIRAFSDPNRIVREDHRWDYGERRYQLLGEIDGRVFFVAYTLRRSVVRIISARKANHRESTEYDHRSRQN